MVNRERMAEQLMLHEGVRLAPYRCSEGYLTVLVGYNIDARGWTELGRILGRQVGPNTLYTNDDAKCQIQHDIEFFEQQVANHFAIYHKLDEVRQRVVLDFVFNLGNVGAAKFKSAIRMMGLAVQQVNPELKEACFAAAAFHAMDSLWSRQVDDGLGGRYGRADRLAKMLVTGKDYTK